MPSVIPNLDLNVNVDGKNFRVAGATDIPITNLERVEPTVQAAISGVLTTRTDNDTGQITVATGHGYGTSDDVVVWWLVAGVYVARYMMDLTATGATTLDVNLGSGTNLPLVNTAVIVNKVVTVPCQIQSDADQVQGVFASCGGAPNGMVKLYDAVGAALGVGELHLIDGYDFIWMPQTPKNPEIGAHPFSSANVGSAKFTHNHIQGPKVMSFFCPFIET